MERIVIVAYRPKPGMQSRLRALMKTHVPRLREQGLVSERAPIVMEAEGGTVVEVFEWKSKEAIEQAHANEAVQRMWQEYAEVCEYVPIGQVPEASNLFSEFTPLSAD